MSRPVYVSTNCFRDRSTEGIVAAVAEDGWSRVEMSAVRATGEEAIALSRRLRADGVGVLLHNYFPPPREPFVLNLGSSNPDVRERSLRHCEEAIELSSELGAPFYAAHAGFALDLPPELLGNPARQRQFICGQSSPENARDAWAIFVESVGALVEFGRRCGVRFLIENHVAGEALGPGAARGLLLGLEAEEFVALGKMFGETDFGILLDVGHLHCTSRVLEFSAREYCAALAPWVRAFHLSDNDGREDGHATFDEDAWFLDFVGSLPEVSATLEFDRCSGEALRRSMEVIRKL